MRRNLLWAAAIAILASCAEQAAVDVAPPRDRLDRIGAELRDAAAIGLIVDGNLPPERIAALRTGLLERCKGFRVGGESLPAITVSLTGRALSAAYGSEAVTLYTGYDLRGQVTFRTASGSVAASISSHSDVDPSLSYSATMREEVSTLPPPGPARDAFYARKRADLIGRLREPGNVFTQGRMLGAVFNPMLGAARDLWTLRCTVI